MTVFISFPELRSRVTPSKRDANAGKAARASDPIPDTS